MLARTGADELAVLVPRADSADVVAILGPVLAQLECAAGVAAFPEHARAPDALYMAADAALTDAIEAGEPMRVAL